MPKRKPESNFLSEPLWIPLAQVKPDPNNANDHTQRSIEAIARSFLRFGMRKNVVADKQKIVRAGNGAYEAIHWILAQAMANETEDQQTIRARALQLGLLREVRKGKATKLEPYIRCEITDLEADEATAYALADNQTGRLSSFNFERVATQLKDLQTRTRIDDLGFADFEIEPLLAAEWKKPALEDLPGIGKTEHVEFDAKKQTENTISFSARDYAIVVTLIAKYRSTLAPKQAEKLLDSECVRLICEAWSES